MVDIPQTTNEVKPPEISSIQKAVEEAVQDPKKRDKLLTIITAFAAKAYSGPLPLPEYLKEYDEILPGLAERIVKMAENQSEHRIDIETKVITAQLVESRIGQIFGLIIGLVGLGATIGLALSGHDTVAGIVGGSTLVSLVAVFVYGKKSQRRDLDRKA